MHLVLCGLQSPVNIGMILRSAEVFRAEVSIVDSFGTLERAGALSTISDFACGAWERQSPRVLPDYSEVPRAGQRLISTTTGGAAVHLSSFRWRPDDVLLIGNEYSGVPALLEERADAALMIEMPQGHLPKPPAHSPIDPERVNQIANAGMRSLNVAVAASILLCDAYSKTCQRAESVHA